MSTASEAGLERDAVGLAPMLFQSITHMAPAAAVAFSIIVGVPYAGGAIPLAVLLALIACLLVAISVGPLARPLPSARRPLHLQLPWTGRTRRLPRRMGVHARRTPGRSPPLPHLRQRAGRQPQLP